MGSYHDELVHGASLIMMAHEYNDFFAQRKAAEEPMLKTAKAMGMEHPTQTDSRISANNMLRIHFYDILIIQ